MSSVDFEGRVTSINYNNATRDTVLDLPLHQVQPFYSALRRYLDIMTRPENVVTYRMEPGELATHTRQGYGDGVLLNHMTLFSSRHHQATAIRDGATL